MDENERGEKDGNKKGKAKSGAKKKAVKKSAQKGAAIKKGSKLACNVCGMVVKVDSVCDCVEVCDIICCNEQMKPKK